MTFLTLLLVLTQTISIGVVDEPLTLANGTKLMPGDRVLAIHDSTHPWLAFLQSGEFGAIDSTEIVVADEWRLPYSDVRSRSDVDSAVWSEPDRRSGRVPWHTRVSRAYLSQDRPFEFCYRDSSFWGPLLAWEADGWLPLARQQVLSSISGSDSSGARALLDMADAMRRGRHLMWMLNEPPDTVKQRKAVRLYELALETAMRHGYREIAADALLTQAMAYLERRDTIAALARLKRTVQEFVGVKSKYGRAHVYATWQMMELAWGQRDTARTKSLARKIIIDFPAEVGEGAMTYVDGWAGSRMHYQRSVWFDVRSAERLLDAVAGDDSQAKAAAEFLTRSKSLAVRFRGYNRLIALSERSSDSVAARSYARIALSLPHYWQLEVWPRSGDTDPGGSRKHDFKDEFIDSLDVLLPFADLLRLYDSTYNSKATMMSRDAASWFMRQIEQGRTPPRAGILDRIAPPRNPPELKRALLASMIGAPPFRTSAACTLFTHRPDAYPNVDRMVTQVLPSGSLLQPYVMREGLVRVATPDGLSGWTTAPSLRGAAILWDIPAIEIVTSHVAEPLTNVDFNGDGVRDLGLSTMDVFDGKGLTALRPAARPYVYVYLTGFFRHKWAELRNDTFWLRGAGDDTAARGVPVARKVKKGVCKPGSCFYFAAGPNPNDSFAWISAMRERGPIWTTPISVRKLGADAIYQVDSTLIITGGDSARLLSAVDGALLGRIAIGKNWRSWHGVFFNRSGYAVAKGESIIYRDYPGSRELRVAIGKNEAVLFPPFAAFFESDIWGVGRFGQSLCPVAAEAIPFVSLIHRYDGERTRYDITLHLISSRDGRELATVAMSENYYDCRYDEHGVYVSDDSGFRAVTWEGKPLAVADLPLLSFPIWNGNRIVSYYSRPMGTMFEAGAASRLADAVRPLRAKWPAMDNRWESVR